MDEGSPLNELDETEWADVARSLRVPIEQFEKDWAEFVELKNLCATPQVIDNPTVSRGDKR